MLSQSLPTSSFILYPYRYFLGLLGLTLILLSVAFLHISLGAKNIPWSSVYQALTAFDHANSDHNIIQTIRIPRLYVSLIIGAALAIAGILMQAVSHNPLADPGLLGVNSGAAFFVVVGALILSGTPQAYLPLYAFAGAFFAALLVFFLGGRKNNSEQLVLAGVAVTAFFSAMTAIVLLVDQQGLDKLRHWMTGSIGASDLKKMSWIWPYLVIGCCLTIFLTKSLNTYHLGDRVASSLGLNIKWLKLGSLLVVVLLSGSVVALSGPIGFVGLVVPHMARMLVGTDYRWLLPYTFVCGSLLMVSADLAARVMVRPYEINTGIITALVGAPVFIALVIGRLR